MLGCFNCCGKRFELFPVFYLVKSITLQVSSWAWRDTPLLLHLSLYLLTPGGRSKCRCSPDFLCCMCIDMILVKLYIINKRARCWGLAPGLTRWLWLPERLLPMVGSGSSRGWAAQRREQKTPLPPRGAEDPEQKVHVPPRSSLSASRSPFFSTALRWGCKQSFFWFKFLCAATRN